MRWIRLIVIIILGTVVILWSASGNLSVVDRDGRSEGVEGRSAVPLQKGGRSAGVDRSAVRQVLEPSGASSRSLAVEIFSHGLDLPVGQIVLKLVSKGWKREFSVAGSRVMTIVPINVKLPLLMRCENIRGADLSDPLVVRKLPASLGLELTTEIPVPMRFEAEDGKPLAGLLYTNVHRSGPARRSRAAEPVKVKACLPTETVHVAMKVDQVHRQLCGYVRGYTPRMLSLEGHPGFPWNLGTVVMRFTQGAIVKGRVRDRSGSPVAAQSVLIRSSEACQLAGQTSYLSFGPKHSRVSGGISETVRTDEHGYFTFQGVPLSVPFRLTVTGPRTQVWPDPSRILRVRNSPFVTELLVR